MRGTKRTDRHKASRCEEKAQKDNSEKSIRIQVQQGEKDKYRQAEDTHTQTGLDGFFCVSLVSTLHWICLH